MYDAADADEEERAAIARLEADAYTLAVKDLCRQSFKYYVLYSFLKHKNRKWRRANHHWIICDALTRVFNGECKRLIINLPPRYSKTELAVVKWVGWCLGQCPDAEFIHASYTAGLATKNSYNTKSEIASDWYKAIFPDTHLAADSKSRREWRTKAGGVFYATGTDGTITGFGAGKMPSEDRAYTFGGALIIDDPHKVRGILSDKQRQKAVDWYPETAESRLNDPDNTPVILIMQRLHEADLSGWLIAGGNGEVWEQVIIPARDDEGLPIWPEKHNDAALKRLEAKNPYVYAGQYMQRPSPKGGGIFKTAWWKYFTLAGLPKPKRILQSWDTAFKKGAENDYSVCTTIAECEGGDYVLEVLEGKWEYPTLKRLVVSQAAKWKPNTILIEDKASGQSLIQDLKNENGLPPVVAIKVDSDKITRANAITGHPEGGRVFLLEGAEWLARFVHQFEAFPNGLNDDMIDSFTQALNYLHLQPQNTGLLDFLKEKFEAQQAQQQATKETPNG